MTFWVDSTDDEMPASVRSLLKRRRGMRITVRETPSVNTNTNTKTKRTPQIGNGNGNVVFTSGDEASVATSNDSDGQTSADSVTDGITSPDTNSDLDNNNGVQPPPAALGVSASGSVRISGRATRERLARRLARRQGQAGANTSDDSLTDGNTTDPGVQSPASASDSDVPARQPPAAALGVSAKGRIGISSRAKKHRLARRQARTGRADSNTDGNTTDPGVQSPASVDSASDSDVPARQPPAAALGVGAKARVGIAGRVKRDRLARRQVRNGGANTSADSNTDGNTTDPGVLSPPSASDSDVPARQPPAAALGVSAKARVGIAGRVKRDRIARRQVRNDGANTSDGNTTDPGVQSPASVGSASDSDVPARQPPPAAALSVGAKGRVGISGRVKRHRLARRQVRNGGNTTADTNTDGETTDAGVQSPASANSASDTDAPARQPLIKAKINVKSRRFRSVRRSIDKRADSDASADSSESEDSEGSKDKAKESGDEDEKPKPSGKATSGVSAPTKSATLTSAPSAAPTNADDGGNPVLNPAISDSSAAPTITSQVNGPTGVALSIDEKRVSSTGQNLSPSETQSAEAAISEKASGPTLRRGAEVGIVFGALGLLALIIVGGIFIYKRRKRSRGVKIEEYPQEKGFYSGSPDAGYRTDSRIMDNAMVAAYGVDSGNANAGTLDMIAQQQQQQRLSRDYFDSDQKQYQMEPAAPVPIYMQGPNPQEQQTVLAHNQQNLGIYPPGQVPIGKSRVQSMARTEVTDATESTWRTWNVDQGHATRQKGWKEKYLS